MGPRGRGGGEPPYMNLVFENMLNVLIERRPIQIKKVGQPT